MKRTVLLLACLAAGLMLVIACASSAKVPPQPPILPPVEEKPQAGMKAESLPPTPTPTPPPGGQKVAALKTVHFDFDRSVIRSEDAEIMKDNAAYLKANASVRISAEGYCDPVGTEEYNRGLGLRRANSAKAYLVNLGIDASRISVISFGEERLVTTNPAEFLQNRRVEFKQK